LQLALILIILQECNIEYIISEIQQTSGAPFPQISDPAEKSSTDAAMVEWRRC
jgi:hypothetical protein